MTTTTTTLHRFHPRRLGMINVAALAASTLIAAVGLTAGWFSHQWATAAGIVLLWVITVLLVISRIEAKVRETRRQQQFTHTKKMLAGINEQLRLVQAAQRNAPQHPTTSARGEALMGPAVQAAAVATTRFHYVADQLAQLRSLVAPEPEVTQLYLEDISQPRCEESAPRSHGFVELTSDGFFAS